MRHTDAGTGFTHHGFLNVLLATERALDGAEIEDAAGVLAVTDGAELAERVKALTVRGRRPATRDLFHGFGSLLVAEPIDDLSKLGLLPTELVRTARTAMTQPTWVALPTATDFPVENLPYGVFATHGERPTASAIRIGDSRSARTLACRSRPCDGRSTAARGTSIGTLNPCWPSARRPGPRCGPG